MQPDPAIFLFPLSFVFIGPVISARAAADAGGGAGLAVTWRVLAERASPSVLLLAVQPQQDRRVLRVTGAGRALPGGSSKAACCPRPHAVARASDRGRAGSAPGLRGPHGARLLPRGMGWLPPHPFSDLHNEGLRAPWDRERSVNQSLDSLQARGSWEKQTGNEKNTHKTSERGRRIYSETRPGTGGRTFRACVLGAGRVTWQRPKQVTRSGPVHRPSARVPGGRPNQRANE